MEHWRYYIQGRALEAVRQHDAAITTYRAALRTKPDFHRCTNRIAYILASQQRYAEAAENFSRLVKLDPDNAVAHFNLGYSREQLGQQQDAIGSFRAATRLNPKIDRAWYGMGICHAHLGQHAEAAVALEQVALLQPMNPHAWYALGMAQHANGNAARLREFMLHLLRFDPRIARRLIEESESTALAYLVKDLMP